jgi:hypothetical protein
MNTFPNASTAAQNVVVGHDTPVKPEFHDESIVLTDQAELPPVGSVEVTTLPLLSTATQRDADGHDNPL